MEGYAKQKVTGGKLVIIKVRYSTKIEHIQILGDFFIHPEEALKKVESGLVGTEINASEQQLVERVKSSAGNAEFVGITPEAIAQTIKMAIK